MVAVHRLPIVEAPLVVENGQGEEPGGQAVTGGIRNRHSHRWRESQGGKEAAG